jgi:hypothetical protein
MTDKQTSHCFPSAKLNKLERLLLYGHPFLQALDRQVLVVGHKAHLVGLSLFLQFSYL